VLCTGKGSFLGKLADDLTGEVVIQELGARLAGIHSAYSRRYLQSRASAQQRQPITLDGRMSNRRGRRDIFLNFQVPSNTHRSHSQHTDGTQLAGGSASWVLGPGAVLRANCRGRSLSLS